MAVLAAQAFKFLDKQTHNPVIDLSSITGSDIYNTVVNGVKETAAAVQELIGSIQDKAKAVASAAWETVKEMGSGIAEFGSSVVDAAKAGIEGLSGVVRNVVNGVTSFIDMAGNSLSGLESFIASILPIGVSRSVINSMARRCKDSLGMQNVLGRPYDISGQCGSGGRSGCTSGSVSNLLNSLTKGGYNSGYNDINALLSGLVGLTNMSYSANMCGAFSTILAAMGGLSNAQIGRAGASVIERLAGTGNLFGFADMSKYVQGLGVSSALPFAIAELTSNVGGYSESRVASVATSAFAGFELFDDNWAMSNDSGYYSTRNFSDMSSGMNDVFRSEVYSGGGSALSYFDDRDSATVYAAASTSNASTDFFSGWTDSFPTGKWY